MIVVVLSACSSGLGAISGDGVLGLEVPLVGFDPFLVPSVVGLSFD